MKDMEKLFESINSEILNDEVKLSLSVMFENSLNEAIQIKETQLAEANKVEITKFKDKLADKIDDYLQFFAEEFARTNAKAIEDSVKVKLAEKIMKTFNGIITDFSIKLDEKVVANDDALVEAQKKVEALTKQLIESKKETKIREKAGIIAEAASKLKTDMEKTKLTKYATTIEFDELFEKKIKAFAATILVESKVKEEIPTKEKLTLTEEIHDVEFKTELSQMEKYLKGIK